MNRRNYNKLVAGWINAGGHDGVQTLKDMSVNAVSIANELAEQGKRVSWYALGYTMYLAQSIGKQIAYKEIKENELSHKDL